MMRTNDVYGQFPNDTLKLNKIGLDFKKFANTGRQQNSLVVLTKYFTVWKNSQ